MLQLGGGGGFNARHGMIGQVFRLQNAPIGKHNPHQALDFMTLNNRAAPIVAYMTAAMIDRASFGRYSVWNCEWLRGRGKRTGMH